MEFGESQILGEVFGVEKFIGIEIFYFVETKFLFRGTKKPGTGRLSLGGGQNTKTVPGWWTKIVTKL
jgi:hypothetical protein